MGYHIDTVGIFYRTKSRTNPQIFSVNFKLGFDFVGFIYSFPNLQKIQKELAYTVSSANFFSYISLNSSYFI